MGAKERREREREEIRTLIMDAARKLFVEEGYESVSMRKIAQAIDYTPTAIYFHFKDKKALLDEICLADFTEFAHLFQKHLSIADPLVRLRELGLTYLDFALTHPQQYRFMFMTPTTHSLEPSEERLSIKGNPEQDAYALLRLTCVDAINKGRIRIEYQNADLLTQMAWATIHGVASLHLVMAGDPWFDWIPARKQAETLLEVFLRGVINPASDPR